MKILIACAGSAGHIFPALALAEELKKDKNDCQITMVVSSLERDKTYLESAGSFLKQLRIERVISAPLPYKFSFRYLYFALRLFLAFWQSLVIILKSRPQVVIGFGGYSSFAPIVIARIMGSFTLIHEQNVIPGRANHLLARIVDRVAVSFAETDKFFPRIRRGSNIVNTGLPLRRKILDRRDNSLSALGDIEHRKFTIIVLGGSQGAHKVNELVLDCLARMDKTTLEHLQVIHLTGKMDFGYVLKRYEALSVSSHVLEFLEDMKAAYRISDLLIARAGAGTIFEAATFGLPSILIPHSGGTGHQKKNASYLKSNGAALVLDEQSALPEDLEKMLYNLIGNQRLREDLSRKIKMLAVPEAARKLKDEVMALSRGCYVQQ